MIQPCHPARSFVHEVTRPTSIALRPYKPTFGAGFKSCTPQICCCSKLQASSDGLRPLLQPWQQLVGLLGLLGVFAYQERPRGWCDKALVQVVAHFGCLFANVGSAVLASSVYCAGGRISGSRSWCICQMSDTTRHCCWRLSRLTKDGKKHAS